MLIRMALAPSQGRKNLQMSKRVPKRLLRPSHIENKALQTSDLDTSLTSQAAPRPTIIFKKRGPRTAGVLPQATAATGVEQGNPVEKPESNTG
jgi:hypothetical protein